MGGGNDDQDEAEKNKQAEDNIEIWKIKKLIKSLQAARGCVTSQLSGCACLQLIVYSGSSSFDHVAELAHHTRAWLWL